LTGRAAFCDARLDAAVGESLITGLAGELDWRARRVAPACGCHQRSVAELYFILKSSLSLDLPFEPFAPLAGTIRLERAESRASFPWTHPRVEFNAS
jgi:hypothetical protein